MANSSHFENKSISNLENNPFLSQRATGNPYRTALFTALDRLAWDLDPLSWSSRKKMKALHNSYLGQKAVIICNGPSLLKVDLSILEEVYTFGLNKINLLFDKSSFRPSSIVAVNSFVLEQNAPFFMQSDIDLFLNSTCNYKKEVSNHAVFLHLMQQPKFVRDCSVSLYHGYTVTYVAMQLAFHMGFHDVALVGCDHNFSSKGFSNQIVQSKDKDDNHFDPKYFADGVKWQLPDLVQSEMAYNMAREMFESSGRRLINCTEGGKLDILERLNLQEWINQ